MISKTYSLWLGTGLLVIPIIGIAQSCSDVYVGSTRNIDAVTRSETELNNKYAQHCEANGSLKNSSANVDLSAEIRLIKGSFAGSQTQAVEEMRQFCKTRQSSFASTSDLFAINNAVVVEALQSYNQCMLIEKQGLKMSHTANNSSLIIRGDYNPATTQVQVQAVSYTPNTGTCRATASGAAIQSGTKPFNTTGPFTLSCTRTAKVTKTGLAYPRFEVITATNHGNYSVVLLADEIFNLDVASEHKRELAKLKLQRNKDLEDAAAEKQRLLAQVATEIQKANALQSRLDNVTVRTYDFVQGDGQVVPCRHPQNAPTLEQHVASVCGSDKPLLGAGVALPVSNTGRCGHTQYRLNCVKIQ